MLNLKLHHCVCSCTLTQQLQLLLTWRPVHDVLLLIPMWGECSLTGVERSVGDHQGFTCHWTGCLCFCAPAEGSWTCSAVVWGGWSAGWTVRWGSCVRRRSPPTTSPSRFSPTAGPLPGPPDGAPADPSCSRALWLSPEDETDTPKPQPSQLLLRECHTLYCVNKTHIKICW